MVIQPRYTAGRDCNSRLSSKSTCQSLLSWESGLLSLAEPLADAVAAPEVLRGSHAPNPRHRSDLQHAPARS